MITSRIIRFVCSASLVADSNAFHFSGGSGGNIFPKGDITTSPLTGTAGCQAGYPGGRREDEAIASRPRSEQPARAPGFRHGHDVRTCVRSWEEAAETARQLILRRPDR